MATRAAAKMAKKGYQSIHNFFVEVQTSYTSFNIVRRENGDLFSHAEPEISTLGSTTPSSHFFGDIRIIYGQFKAAKKKWKKKKETEKVRMQDVLEDVQFCGVYLCGIDLVWEDAESEGNSHGGIPHQKRREERKEEAEEAFLGKIIKIGNKYGCGSGARLCGR